MRQHMRLSASEVIDPELGRGHSNLCEAAFSVYFKFRPKDTNLHRLHYQASKKLGLLRVSMTYLYKTRSPEYHWIIELLEKIDLPVINGMNERA